MSIWAYSISVVSKAWAISFTILDYWLTWFETIRLYDAIAWASLYLLLLIGVPTIWQWAIYFSTIISCTVHKFVLTCDEGVLTEILSFS